MADEGEDPHSDVNEGIDEKEAKLPLDLVALLGDFTGNIVFAARVDELEPVNGRGGCT